MSDGDNATPGRPRASDSNGANQWLSRSPLPPRSAAPWERTPAGDPEADDDTSSQTNSHTDGVTVADLIAKVTGATPTDLPSRHAAAEPEPGPTPPRSAAPPPPQPPARPGASPPRQPRQLRPHRPQPPDRPDPDTDIIPVVSYADEIPALGALRRARLERVAPERGGQPAGEPLDPPKRK